MEYLNTEELINFAKQEGESWRRVNSRVLAMLNDLQALAEFCEQNHLDEVYFDDIKKAEEAVNAANIKQSIVRDNFLCEKLASRVITEIEYQTAFCILNDKDFPRYLLREGKTCKITDWKNALDACRIFGRAYPYKPK